MGSLYVGGISISFWRAPLQSLSITNLLLCVVMHMTVVPPPSRVRGPWPRRLNSTVSGGVTARKLALVGRALAATCHMGERFVDVIVNRVRGSWEAQCVHYAEEELTFAGVPEEAEAKIRSQNIGRPAHVRKRAVTTALHVRLWPPVTDPQSCLVNHHCMACRHVASNCMAAPPPS